LEYIELQLCREFHCLPSQLRAEADEDILRILEMKSVEARVQQRKKKARRG
jgi:hypothetical protein